MKNKKTKNFFGLKAILLFLFFSIGTAYGSDILSISIWNQVATENGSNGSNISIIAGEEVAYWNAGNNSTVIGNYFKWYYHDSVFWYFKLDWSTDSSENVNITKSTSACSTWYGYKLGWYAYSEYFWFMDFDYNSNIFVYYCVDDNELHGHAYNDNIWFQNFEGIVFDVLPNVGTITENTSTGVFVNDNTKINFPNFWDGNINSYISGDMIQLEDDKESIFYIIK